MYKLILIFNMAGEDIIFRSNVILNVFGYLCFINFKGWGVGGMEVCIDPHGNMGTCDEGWECCEDGTQCCLENWPMLTITGIVIGCLVGLVLVISCCAVVVYTACNKTNKPRRVVYPGDTPHISTIDGSRGEFGPVLFSAQGPPAYQFEPPPYTELAESPSNNDTDLGQSPPRSHKLMPSAPAGIEPPPYTESTH